MISRNGKYRTVFLLEIEQLSGLSTGGSEGDSPADAAMARDGAGRFILRGSGLAGALLATLNEFDLTIPPEISAHYQEAPSTIADGDEVENSIRHESLWLMHHARCDQAHAVLTTRPHVAIHPWSGAAVDGLYFSTEVLPRGTKWKTIIETDDWRERDRETELEAPRLLALALQQWQKRCCWLGRAPARGLGWARLTSVEVFRLNEAAAAHWPDATRDSEKNHEWLRQAAADTMPSDVVATTLEELTKDLTYDRRTEWRFYQGTLTVGEDDTGEPSYGLDTLSALTRDFPADDESWELGRGVTLEDEHRSYTAAPINLDHPLAWGPKPNDAIEFLIPGSAIRGSLRSAISAHRRRAGMAAWAPNGAVPEPENAENDVTLAVFGSISNDSHLLVSDAYPVDGCEPKAYVQELHAEDEFTQGPYASSKFNRPCLVSGTFSFRLALRESLCADAPGLPEDTANEARALLRLADALGKERMIPFGGGVWRGHGWIGLSLEELGDETKQERP